MKALVIKNNKPVTEQIKRDLTSDGYRDVKIVNSGSDGLYFASMITYDVIILGVKLPDILGFETLSKLRSKGITSPILMVSDIASPNDKAKGLNLGADDYLALPFDDGELIARVRSITRRGKELKQNYLFEISDLEFDSSNLMLTAKDESIHLVPKEAEIFENLIKYKDIPLSAEWILLRAWDLEDEVDVTHVRQQISRLRRKLKMLNSNIDIKVVHKKGYLLVEKEDK